LYENFNASCIIINYIEKLVGLLTKIAKNFYMLSRKTMTAGEKVFFNKVRKVKSNICEKNLLNQRKLLVTPNIHGNK
jgi:hypothetical protein